RVFRVHSVGVPENDVGDHVGDVVEGSDEGRDGGGTGGRLAMRNAQLQALIEGRKAEAVLLRLTHLRSQRATGDVVPRGRDVEVAGVTVEDAEVGLPGEPTPDGLRQVREDAEAAGLFGNISDGQRITHVPVLDADAGGRISAAGAGGEGFHVVLTPAEGR